MEEISTSKFNSFVTKNGNKIWAGALTLAWNQLKTNIVKQNIQLQTNNHQALRIIDNFNNSTFSAECISSDSIYVKSGFGNQTIKIINKEVKTKFKHKSFKELVCNLTKVDIISYAYIFKRLSFLNSFKRNLANNFLFNNKQVKSFFAENKTQKKQVLCYDYKNQQNFIIGIKSKEPKDQIFMIKSEEKMEVDLILEIVQKYQENTKPQSLNQSDMFEMPVISLTCERSIKQLIQCKFTNQHMKQYVLAEIREAIKLNIDETGVKMENEGVIKLLKCKKVKKIDEPKRIIINRSFWIVMKEVENHPYACFFIEQPIDQN